MKTNLFHFKENFRLLFKMTTLWSNQNTSVKSLFYKTFFKLRENSCVSIWECKGNFGTSAQIQLSDQKMAKWSWKKWLIWGFSVWHQHTPVQRLGRQKYHGVFCSWWELSDQRWTLLVCCFSGFLGSFLGWVWADSIKISTKNEA